MENFRDNENSKIAGAETEALRRRSSRQNSGESGSTILRKQCIFCKINKYTKNSRTRETLSSCIQIRADDKIRTLAKIRCDPEILAIASDELIAKEAHYHFSCYREYVRSYNENQDKTIIDKDLDQDDDGLPDVIECLNDLRRHPKCMELKSLQLLIKTKSGKKNLKRTIERKTNDFKFTKCSINTLIYPCSWKTDDIVSELFEAQKQLLDIERSNEPERIVHQSGSIVRNEVKNMEYEMPWPPTPEYLNIFGFQIPKYLDSLLSVLLSGNINIPSDRVNRLKFSFAQDIIYAGIL